MVGGGNWPPKQLGDGRLGPLPYSSYVLHRNMAHDEFLPPIFSNCFKESY